MDILFIGDSLVEGSIGVNFLPLIKKEKPNLTLLNQGINGDTLPGISRRLLHILKREHRYASIVIEGGHNDLLMSSWLKQEEGQVLELTRLLEETLRQVKAMYQGDVVLTTLSCLGEELAAEPNQKRQQLNSAIKELGRRYGCKVADVGHAFDEELRGGEQGDDFLHLTTDGVHINKKGAALYAREILKCLP